MAIVQNPITGRTKKAFGTAVFSKSYEIPVPRGKCVKGTNLEPPLP